MRFDYGVLTVGLEKGCTPSRVVSRASVRIHHDSVSIAMEIESSGPMEARWLWTRRRAMRQLPQPDICTRRQRRNFPLMLNGISDHLSKSGDL